MLTAAILVPAGFFLSVIGPNPARPGKMRSGVAGGRLAHRGGCDFGVVLLVAGIGAL